MLQCRINFISSQIRENRIQYEMLNRELRKELEDFQNDVIPQRVDGFLCSTPEMKARDAYVPFLLSKPLNKT